MKTYLLQFLHDFDYPEQAKRELPAALDTVLENDKASALLSEALQMYRDNYRCDFRAILDKSAEIAVAAGLCSYVTDLIVPILLSQHLRELYRENGIDDSIWHASMCDLKYKCMECILVKGMAGTFVADWFCWFFSLQRFQFCKLQFERVKFRHTYSKYGVNLLPDATVINVHIPRTGTPLDEASLQKSFAEAAGFFETRYAQKPVFVCHSWLLFPEHLKMLPESANICRFIRCFDLMESGFYDNYGERWRLFDTMEPDTEKLPANTTLRRAYIDLMRKGEKTGWGYGIYVYDRK